MSNVTLVNDALRLIGVLPEGETASAEDGERALRIGRELVDEWADDGIIVSWSPNVSLDDECSLHGIELSAVKYTLAVRLCPFYGRDPTQTLIAMASAAYTRLLRQQVVVEASEPVLPMPEGTRYRWNIEDGN